MKALALITQNDEEQVQWLFDRIMTMIAYDLDLSVVFIADGCTQLIENKIWKVLPMYGVDKIYDFNTVYERKKNLIFSNEILRNELKKLISQADIIL